MHNKLYVLIRGDLSKSQQAVQACHAVAEFMLYDNNVPCKCGRCRDDRLWENETIVLLKVRDLHHLIEWSKRIRENTSTYNEFSEPDLNNEYTAIAAHGDNLENMLKELPLL